MPEIEIKPRYASHSSLSTHRVCPQRFYYRHIRKLAKVDPDDAAVERDFGSWWHMLRAADSITQGLQLKSLQWVPEELMSTDDGPRIIVGSRLTMTLLEQVMEAAEYWWDKQSPLTQQTWAERIGEDLPNRLWALDMRYQARWSFQQASERPLAVELRWERRLPALTQPHKHDPYGACAGLDGPCPDTEQLDPNVILVGYVDVVYEDIRRKVIVARDHKTGKKLDTQTAADDMMDSQLQLYAWGASPTVSAWGLGPIKATTYDRARMTRPITPKVTISGTLSKSITDYDLKTYLDWCASSPEYAGRTKDGSQAGVYQREEREVDRLSTQAALSAWFQRTGPTPLNPHLIRAHLRAAVDSALDMGLSYQRAELEHAAARNLTSSNCKWCDFTGLCHSEMFGGAGGDFDLADFRLVQKRARR